MTNRSQMINSQYLHHLCDIISQDFNQNGYCRASLTISHCQYTVSLILDKQMIKASIQSPSSHQYFETNSYPIKGSLNQDRTIIHHIHDEILPYINGQKGIASIPLLFASQTQSSSTKQCISEIWQSDYDGSNQHPITNQNSYCISPYVFSVHGLFTDEKYIYINYKHGQPKIYLGTFDNSIHTPLISLRGNQLLPTISPRGDMIAFICDASGRADLFIQPFSPKIGPVGKPKQLYSYPHAVQASPTFHPSGKKIAFVSDQEGTPHIFIISTPSSNAPQPQPICLTKNYRHNTCPAWSPDGTKLTYSSMVDGIRQIMIYDFLRQEEYILTRGDVHKENPAWAPNSFHITYNTVGTSSDIYIINLKQKKPIKIISGLGKSHYPTWKNSKKQ